MPTVHSPAADAEYDTESVIAVLQMVVTAHGDVSLKQAYSLIDWRVVRLHGETREQYQSRMIALSENA